MGIKPRPAFTVRHESADGAIGTTSLHYTQGAHALIDILRPGETLTIQVSEPVAVAESLPAHVELAEIDHQRFLGWPDFHPEDYCHRCGNRNIPSWSVDSDRFNIAMGREHQWNGIICPTCFVDLHEQASGLVTTWRLVPEMFRAGTWDELRADDIPQGATGPVVESSSARSTREQPTPDEPGSVTYDPTADALYIRLLPWQPAYQREPLDACGVIVDHAADGSVIGVELLHVQTHIKIGKHQEWLDTNGLVSVHGPWETQGVGTEIKFDFINRAVIVNGVAHPNGSDAYQPTPDEAGALQDLEDDELDSLADAGPLTPQEERLVRYVRESLRTLPDGAEAVPERFVASDNDGMASVSDSEREMRVAGFFYADDFGSAYEHAQADADRRNQLAFFKSVQK